MILLIIFGVLFVAGLLFGILGYRQVFTDRNGYYSDANEVANIGGIVAVVFSGLGLVICSIAAIITLNAKEYFVCRW